MPYQAPTNPPQLPDLNANFMDEQYYQKDPDGKYWFEFLNSLNVFLLTIPNKVRVLLQFFSFLILRL